MKKCKLVIANLIEAKCSCGEWTYIGMTPEAQSAIQKVYNYHLPATIKKLKAKKRK
jgi:hypothetical protein